MSKNAATETVEPLPWESADGTSEGAAADALMDLASEEIEETTEDQDGPLEGNADEAAPDPDEEGEEPESEEEFEEMEEQEQDEEEPDSEPTFKVTVDGEEIEVTLSELRNGYSRHSDYTRKTQAVAEERKAVQAEAQQLRVVREQEAQRLAQIEEVLESLQPAEPDWETLRRENPVEFAAQWAEHSQRQQQIAYIQQQRQQAEALAAQQRQQELAGVLEQERVKLLEAIPAWKDQAKAAEGKRKLAEYAKSLGYTEQDLNQVYDHRLMVILNKAAAYDAIQTSKGQVVTKKVAQPAKTLRPGVRPTKPTPTAQKNGARAVQRLSRTGSVNDAAAAILNLDL